MSGHADGEMCAQQRAYDKQVSEMLRTLADINTIIDTKELPGQVPMFMTPEASAELRDLIARFLMHYSFLHEIARSQVPPIIAFNKVSKFHALWHVGLESKYSHPASGRTYINEDYMQKAKAVGESCRHRVAAHKRSAAVASKIALGRSLDFFVADRDDG